MRSDAAAFGHIPRAAWRTRREVIAWLEDEGGHCDCAVIANVEERWREIFDGAI
jgi:hypothetical protein